MRSEVQILSPRPEHPFDGFLRTPSSTEIGRPRDRRTDLPQCPAWTALLTRLVGAFPPCDRGPEARESDKRHDSDGTGRDRLDLRPSGSGQDGRHRPWEPRSHPRTVRICASTIVQTLTSLGANRFDLKYGMGGLRQQALMTNIELYGTEVIPASASFWRTRQSPRRTRRRSRRGSGHERRCRSSAGCCVHRRSERRPQPGTGGRPFGQDAASRTRAVSTNCSNRTIRPARTTK